MNGGQSRPPAHPDEHECPVCEWPAGPLDVSCRRCGWELRGSYLAGHPAQADYDDVASRLAAARQHWDVRAAVLAVRAAGGSDTDRLGWLCRLARDGEPTTATLQRIQQSVEEKALRPSSALGAGYALARLVAGETSRIAFLEIGQDEVSVEILTADDLGVPRRQSTGSRVAWRNLLPLLPDDTDLRRFQLAGGIGNSEPDHRPPALADITALRASLSGGMRLAMEKLLANAAAVVVAGPAAGLRVAWPTPDVDIVLVRRAAGWAFLEAAADLVRSYARPVADIAEGPASGTLAAIVDRIAGLAPIRHAYGLVLVAVDPEDGTVRLDPCPLFPAGAAARPHVKREVKVDVMPSAYSSAMVTLPVVANVGSEAANWPLVGGLAINGVAGDTTQLRVWLQGPGRLVFDARPAEVQPPTHVLDWPALLSDMPRRLPKAQTVDVAFLVELGGEPANVAGRVRSLIGALGASAPAGAVRVAVLGYREHHGPYRIDATEEDKSLLVGEGLGSVAAAHTLLNSPETWAAVPVYDGLSTPLEDALEFLLKRGDEWRRNARHLLCVVGSRPPHPEKVDPQGGLAVPCPHGHSWLDLFNDLRWQHEVEGIVVLDGHPPRQRGRGYSEQAWRRLGSQGRFSREKANVGQLVQAIGLVADSSTARLGLAVRATTPFLVHGIRGGS
jgi:hypothetical protein